jgi:hypothetical protein
MFTTLIGAGLIIYGLIVVPIRTRGRRAQARLIATTEPTPADEVGWRAEQTPGATVSVAGAAGPGPGGPLEAPISGRPCVWHRVVEIERRVHRRSGGGAGHSRRRTEVREHVVRDEASPAPFTVTDAHGEVLVRPTGADVRDLAPVVDRHDEVAPDPDNTVRVGVGRFGVDLNTSNLRGVITREYLIEDGQALSVRGAAVAGDDGGEIGRPADGPFIISTLPLAELAEAERGGTRKQILLGVAAAAVGAVLAVTGLLA